MLSKNTFIFLVVLILKSLFHLTIAAPIGSGFTYQGQLTDGGVPANGQYNIQIALMLTETGGPVALAIREFQTVQVTNGLFTIPDVDFGSAFFDGTQYWLQILVKLSSDPGFHQALLPRQKLSAVPYAVQADFLAANGASTNDLLQFDGTDWVASATALSPWTKVGTKVSYTGGRVGIGTSNPNATLHISSSPTDDPFRAQIGSATKFVVKNNGGMSIGVNANPPVDGLYVHGDAKQDANSSGFIKYLVYAFCTNGVSGGSFTGPSQINRSKNNVNGGSITIANGPNEGQCDITFPSTISTRYWQTSITGLDPNLGTHCTNISSTKLRCYGIKLSNGNPRAVNLMLTVY